MPEVTLTGHFIVPESDLQAILKELPNHIAASRNEPGCIKFEATQDDVQPNKFHLSERFASPEAFEQHKERAARTEWATAAVNIERHFNIKGLDVD